MKVTFILPAVGKKENDTYVDSWKMEPLNIQTLSSLTPPDVEKEFFDDRIEHIDYDTKTDLVAITVETYTAKRAYSIASRFRKRGIPVILGGYHPTLVPSEAKEYADAILIGEAEGVWERIIEDARKKRLRKVYRGKRLPMEGVFPDRSINGKRKYLPITLVETGRGCRFACNFCSVSVFYERTRRKKDIKKVVEEIERSGAKNVFFVDDNLAVEPAWLEKLAGELIPLKIRWAAQATVLVAKFPKLLDVLAKSGCKVLLIGFESLNPENLEAMNKRWNMSLGDYHELIKRIHSSGIFIYATFVFGYPHDDMDTIKRTLDFALRERFLIAAFNHLVPFPGTPLYSMLEKEGRLIYRKWWLDDGYRFGDVAFKPWRLSPEELREGCYYARRVFFSSSGILRRFLGNPEVFKNPFMGFLFLTQNLFGKKEFERRQGLPLGKNLDTGKK
ncbi:radical SAM protein [bacterium]|nr:MAG: radical SAM protein [bacterium]